MNSYRNIFIIVFLVVALRSRAFFTNTNIPLGYDPWLYKEMFLAYYNLGGNRDFSTLAPWIQSMYEPGIGIIGSLYQHLALPFHDSWLTRWWLILSLILPLAAYALGKRINKETGVLAAVLVSLSFVQYAVFWRAYRKQTLGIILVSVVLYCWSSRKIWHTIPLLIMISLINRASLIWIVLIAWIWSISILINKRFSGKRTVLKELFLSGIISGLISLPILRPFLQEQVIGLLTPLFQSVDLPNYNESYQASGTFLATKEYIKVAWFSLLGGIWGLWVMIRRYRKAGHIPKLLISIASIIMLIRVFGQWFFFQRMIGYLDVMMCISCAFALSFINKQRYPILKQIIIWLFLIINGLTTLYRWRVIHPPLISPEEFVSIVSFGRTTTKNDFIISPWIWYSPRIQWWTSWEVLAPGLFDTNTRWDASQWWEQKRYNNSVIEKCNNLKYDYPQLSGNNVYLRIGSKQWQDNFSGWCFRLLTWNNELNYHWYKVDTNSL